MKSRIAIVASFLVVVVLYTQRPATKWEYAIAVVADGAFAARMNEAGRDGWEVTSVRRASNDEVPPTTYAYEVLFRRRTSPFNQRRVKWLDPSFESERTAAAARDRAAASRAKRLSREVTIDISEQYHDPSCQWITIAEGRTTVAHAIEIGYRPHDCMK